MEIEDGLCGGSATGSINVGSVVGCCCACACAGAPTGVSTMATRSIDSIVVFLSTDLVVIGLEEERQEVKISKWISGIYSEI